MFLPIPAGQDPIAHVWGSMVPHIGPASSQVALAVYEHSTLGLEEFEAARLQIALINGCMFCQDFRTERDGEKVADNFFDEVENYQSSTVLSHRAKLTADFARRFATDHHSIDDHYWAPLREEFTDEELVELAMCVASWLGFGRLNRIFGLDTACVIPHDVVNK